MVVVPMGKKNDGQLISINKITIGMFGQSGSGYSQRLYFQFNACIMGIHWTRAMMFTS